MMEHFDRVGINYTNQVVQLRYWVVSGMPDLVSSAFSVHDVSSYGDTSE